MFDSKMAEIRVVLYGIGVIGGKMAEAILEKKGMRIIGAIDIDPNKVGKDLGEVLGKKKVGVKISNDVDGVLAETKPDIVVHTTSSYLKDTYAQFEGIVKHGVNIVSTCEELSYPYVTTEGKTLADKLDKLAKEKKATILGTGINPGFLMDALPIVLTGPCLRVDQITITRQMNAATRRVPFQKKIGAGLTVADFRKKIDGHEITGHVGLEQSIGMIAAALGWKLDEIKVEQVVPVVADKPVKSEAISVPKGNCAGLKQMAKGLVGDKALITLDFRAYIGAEEEFDSVVVEGVPPIRQKISPCVHGDYGTIGMAVNCIPKVIASEPGLKTMKDLPLPSATP